MAAYAALVSLMTTLNNIQLHPRVSTFFHHQQIQSLHEIINFLLQFVESSNSHGGGSSEESRIASTAHAAEDVIESHLVDQIHAGSSDAFFHHQQIHYLSRVVTLTEEGAAKIAVLHQDVIESHLVDQIHAGSSDAFFHHQQIQSLHEIINFLLQFVESSNSHGGGSSEESRIASTAHAAEDVIESHLVDQIHAGSSDAFFHHQQIQSLHEIINFLLQFVESSNSHGGGSNEDSRIASTAHAAEDVIESHLVDQIHAGSSDAFFHHQQIQSLHEIINFLLQFVESSNSHGGGSSEESRIASTAHAAEDVIKSHLVDQIHAGSSDAFFHHQQIQSLHEIINFLLQFVESSNSHGGGSSEDSRIASTAHAAEDVIESHLVDQIHAGSSDAFFHHQQIQSLHEIINFLLQFVESSNSHGGGSSEESRIASTAHAAEDVIESHLVDQIHAGSSDAFFHHQQIQSLHEIINFLLQFVESSNSHGGGSNEDSRIASTAHAAEDVIESHLVDQIHAGSSDAFFHHQQIQSLHEIINFLLQFVESSNSHGGGSSEESRIASTTHASEDVIESHLVDQIHDLLLDDLHHISLDQIHAGSSDVLDLETQIEDINAVKETVMVTEFKGKMVLKDEQSASPSISTAPFTTKKNLVVGFDEKLIQVMDRLTGDQPDLQIVPVVGMGGIGKTTLAKSVYDHLLIVESFDIRAWVTVSQEYSVDNVLSELLSCLEKGKGAGGTDQLGLNLYQTLWGRRYLIVLDDIWSVEAWDKIQCFFPKNDQRSRVVITTRIPSLATHLSSSSFEMNFLDEDQSWELFCGNIFPDKDCPPELEEIGKKIVKECKGLPLSIVAIGGLLRNSSITLEYWENVASDLNSILMSGSDSHCLDILSLSYNHLPAHLKSCFLYMGIFKEDEFIRVPRLIDLFVAEGFLKPKEGQTLEDIAEDYLNDLVDRNLILVHGWRWNGRIRYCKMHDLVREVCLKIGESAKIFHGMGSLDIPADINRVCRIIFYGGVPHKENWPESFSNHLPSASLVRTFLCKYGTLPFKSRLLRVLGVVEFDAPEDISQHVNLRYLHWKFHFGRLPYKLPSSVSLLWNVHTLIFDMVFEAIDVPSEIWYMRQLRHLRCKGGVILPDPPPSEKVEQDEDALLPNLQTLSRVVNFSFTEEVCKRIPNIKKLGIFYWADFNVRECNLGNLYKLQILYCSLPLEEGEFLKSVVLPTSLRKLTLLGCSLRWEDVNTIGLSLPHLQVLNLWNKAVVGSEWDCVEEAFPCLKSLVMDGLPLKKWTAESSDCFPVLEKLHLCVLKKLERIPSGIGETLSSLLVYNCSVSAAISSIEILEEQLNIGNEDFHLDLTLGYKREEQETFIRLMKNVDVKSFTSNNLEFSCSGSPGVTLDHLLSRCVE